MKWSEWKRYSLESSEQWQCLTLWDRLMWPKEWVWIKKKTEQYEALSYGGPSCYVFGGGREESAEEPEKVLLREEENLGLRCPVNHIQQEEVATVQSALVQVKQGQNWSQDLAVGSILVTWARVVVVNCWGWKLHRGEVRGQWEEGQSDCHPRWGITTLPSLPLSPYMLLTTNFIGMSQTSLCLGFKWVSQKCPQTQVSQLYPCLPNFAHQELCIHRSRFSVSLCPLYVQKDIDVCVRLYIPHWFHSLLECKLAGTEVLSFCSRRMMTGWKHKESQYSANLC